MTRATIQETPARRGGERSKPLTGEPVRASRWRAWVRSPWTWLLMVAVAAMIAASNVRMSTGPAAGSAFEGTAAPITATQPRFRVGIFNIHGGRGPDNVRDLTRTADCLRDIDLVGMNEVLGPKLWWQTDQCQQLGKLLDTQWLFAPTESRWWDGSFGNGLLCRLPVTAWQRIPLPRAGAHTHRNVVFSTIDVSGHAVHVLLTHLDSRDAERRHEQLRTVGELFLSLAPPAILLGDMNTLPDDPQLQELLGVPGVVDAVAAGMTEPPPRRIDWLLTRGLRTVAAGCEDHGASDHPLYWADVEVVE
ncbi:MAG TPA: endonuclease/exonuclease/phosphatase family protein [Pirellulales bacterium]|nr:endonuclease/exonuclease/phosphatase family protein [Pirellulales bacterium]